MSEDDNVKFIAAVILVALALFTLWIFGVFPATSEVDAFGNLAD